MKRIEVESGELAIQNSYGDIAIIPKKNRREVEDMIKEKCWDCLDNFVGGLPTTKDYAKDGSLIPNWANPKNWGVPDYSDKGDFNSAYSFARSSGDKEFMWNDQRYNTKYEGTPKEQLEQTGITDEQIQGQNIIKERFRENINPEMGYQDALKRTYGAVIKNQPDMYREYEEGSARDALNLYTGVPQTSGTFGVSDFTPSVSKDKDATYYKMNKVIPETLVGYLNESGDIRKYKDYVSNLDDPDPTNVMNNFKTGVHEDENGKYIYYYDKWDLAPKGKQIDVLGKPFEIYDRIYIEENPYFKIQSELEKLGGKIREYGSNSNYQNKYDQLEQDLQNYVQYKDQPKYIAK